MKFECRIFDEPLLEFGDQHSHPDPRLGLTDAGPYRRHWATKSESAWLATPKPWKALSIF